MPDFDKAVDDYLAQPLTNPATIPQLKNTMANAVTVKPDFEAELQRAATVTGVPIQSARTDPEYTKAKAATLAMDVDGLVVRSPRTADFLGQGDNAALAHDDIGVLESTEHYLKRVGLPAGTPLLQAAKPTRATPMALFRGLFNSTGMDMTNAAMNTMLGDALGWTEKWLGYDTIYGRQAIFPRDTTNYQRDFRMAKGRSEQLTPEIGDPTLRGVYGAGQSIVQTAPAIAVSVASKNPYPALAVMGLQSGTQQYGEVRARGGSAGEAAASGALTGGIEAGTELLPMGFLVNKFGKKGAAAFIGGILAREVPGEQIATLAQDAVDTAIANPDKTWGEYLAERPGAAYQTLVATLGQAGVMGGVNSVMGRAANRAARREQLASEGERTASGVEAIMQMAEASKLRERAPATFSDFVEQAAEGGPVENIYVDAEVLAQSVNTPENAALLAGAPEIATALQEAQVSGQDVKIPVETFATLFAGTPVYEKLKDHLKTSPDGMTRTQAQEYMDTQGEALRADFERVMAEKEADDGFKASAQAVTENVAGQLATANRFTPDVNEKYASLTGQFYAVQAARLGITPEELFARYPLRVDAGNGQTMGVYNKLGPDLTAPPVDENGNITLTHWGKKGKLKTLDPRKFGTNAEVLSRAERMRAERDDAPGRTYFGIGVGEPGGYVPEYGLGKHRYTGQVPASSLYDYDADPQGLRAGRVKELLAEEGFDAEPEAGQPDYGYYEEAAVAYDKAIQEAGFKGFWTGQQGSGLIGTLFDETPVKYEGADELNQGGKELPLKGLPQNIKVDGKTVKFGPFEPARDAAREYARVSGLPYNPPTEYVKVDEERAKRIAAEFEAMPHAPNDPEVRAAYDAMIAETLAQWEVIKDTGLQVEFIQGEDPYGNPRNAILDVVNNNHLWVYPTSAGFGGSESADVDISGNPLLAIVPGEEISGRPVQANDIFRIVHDYFGHIKEGVGFRADGEENAWRMHSAMYSPLARRAMTTETRGQNSWVNFGPFAESNKTANPADTQYAPQKIGLLPEWVTTEGATDSAVGDAVLAQAGPTLIPAMKVNGKVYTTTLEDGFTPNHGGAWEAAYKADKDALRAAENAEDNPYGYVNHKGQYLSRERAMEYARKNDLLTAHGRRYDDGAPRDLPSEWLKPVGVYGQTATVRSGKETLKKYGLDPTKRYKTREVAAALEARQRAKYGTIEASDRSPEAAKKIAGWMAEEVQFEMLNPERSGVGWYSEKFQRALDTFAQEFPELKTDQGARDLFTALVAVTSDGQKVDGNFAQAADLYGNFKTSGQFTTERGHMRQDSVNGNVAKIQELYETLGPEGMRAYLMQEATVSELKKIAAASGVQFNTAYKADTKLPMAAVVFGPKLGAFYANLMGAQGYLTMDRWWSRTFNRYRGTLLQAPTRAGLDRFKQLLGTPEISDDEALSATVGPRNSYEAKGFKDGSEIEKAANTLYKAAFENLEDQPFNASDRAFMLDTVAQAQKALKRRGVDMTVADIQAVLWYYEKRLYGELGAKQTADTSYEEAAQQVVAARADNAVGPAARGAGESAGEPTAAGNPPGEDDFAGNEVLAQAFEALGIRELLNEADVQLDGEAGRAITSFIGHEPGTVDRGTGDGIGFMNARKLEDAYSTSPSPEGEAIRAEIETAFAPVREQLREQFGDTVRLYRHQQPVGPNGDTVNMSQAADGGRNILSWTTDPLVATAFSGAVEDAAVVSEEEIAAAEQHFAEHGFVKLGRNTLRAVSDGTIEYLGIFNRNVGLGEGEHAADGGFVTDADSVRDFIESQNESAVEWNQRQAGRRAQIISAEVPLDDVVWASDRAGQSEFIVQNREGGAVFVDREGRASGPGVTLAQNNRGTFNPRTSTISLLRTADLSTFLHELGHFQLEVMTDIAGQPDAPQEIVDDVNTLLDWFGVPSLVDWNAMTLEEKRESHEKFARGFEAYLFEGKAPSLKLRSIFQRFRAWMLNVYRELTNLNVELQPGVRQVMDRMLASSEEIKIAEDARHFAPLFSSKPPYMTDEEWINYQNLGAQATQDAVAELETRSLRDMRWLENAKDRILRGLQREAREKRKAVKAEVVAEVMAEPINRARQYLKRGLVDGSETPVEGPHKLSRAAVAELYAGLPEELQDWKKLGSGRYGMLAEDGIHPDVIADMFGFPSGQALVEELLNAEPVNDKVTGMTDQRMLERYGDLTDEDAMSRAADNAIHNDARLRCVATELNALEKAIGGRRVLAQAARAFAEELVQRLKIKDLRTAPYTSAETRAAREADKAHKGGDLIAAATHKRNQLINGHAARAVFNAREEVAKSMTLFKRIVSANDKTAARSRNMDLVNAARAILSQYGIGKVKNTPDHYMGLLQKYDPGLYADLEPYLEAAKAAAKPIREITVEEFQGLRDTVAQLWELSRRAKVIEIDGQQVELDTVTQALGNRLDVLGVPTEQPGKTEEVSKAQRFMRGLSGLRASARRVESWAQFLDGAASGPFRKYIWQPISEAADRYRVDKAKYTAKYLDIVKSIEDTLKPGKIAPIPGGINYTFSGRAELLHAILHSGNESNKRKLLLGRGWGKLTADGELDDTMWKTTVDGYIAKGILTKADFDFAQAVWDLLDETKDAAQKAHRSVFGRYFNEVTADSFETPWGPYRGGYVPALTDSFLVQDAAVRAEQDAIDAGNSTMFPSPTKGFTKGRVEDYTRELALDLRLIPQHIDKVLKFTHLAAPVKDAMRILKSKGFAAKLERFDPVAQTSLLLPWLNRSAKQIVETPSTDPGGRALDGFFRALRQRTGMGVMFANITNALQQLTGFSVSAVRVKPKHLRNAMWQYIRNPGQAAAAVQALSKFMSSRTNGRVFEAQQAIDALLLNPNKYEKARDFTKQHAYFLQSAFQNFVDNVTWMGAYAQAQEEGQTDKESERFANSVVRETQGSLAPEDVSRFETGTAFVRLFTQFQSFFNGMANLMGTELGTTMRDLGLRAGAGRMAYVYMMGFMIPAVVSEVIVQAMKGGPDDDDDDGYLDEIMEMFFGSQLRFGTAMVPIVGPIAQGLVNAANDKPYDDRISTGPGIAAVEASVRAPAEVYKAIAEGKGQKKAVKDTLTLMTLLSGIPVSAAGRPLGYLADINEGKVKPTGPADLGRGLVTGAASPKSKQ